MYSKKINQLATNLNPQGDDLILIGDAETGQLKTTSFNNISDVSSDGVISGGIVTWTGIGLIFDISECVYILNGVRYTSPFTTKTLTAADPTNPRIDVFAVNTSSQVEVIQGTPATNPVEPEGDTQTTLGLTNVTINAGSTTPNGVTRDLIYDENVESWTKSVVQSLSTYSYTNTTYAYTGTKSILATHGGGNSGFLFFLFNKGSQLNVSDFTSISFAIRLNAAMSNGTSLGIQFYDSTTLVSNTYIINSNNSVGFNRTLASVWQFITIPLNGTIIKFTSNKFTTFRIGTSGTAITYNLDTISLNGGINNPGGTTSANSFGFVNGSTGSAASTISTDTLNVVGSGLITTSATGKTLTIASNQIATGSILGRVTASTGNIETLTGTQATTLLDVFTSSLKGVVPASGGGTTNFLRADGTWAAAGGGTTIYTGDGTLTSNRTLTSGGFNLTFTGSNTASSAIARGVNLTHTLVAAANSDVLVGLDINPTFTLGAFTNTNSIGARVVNGKFVVGSSTSAFAAGRMEMRAGVTGSLSMVIQNQTAAGSSSLILGNSSDQYMHIGTSGNSYAFPLASSGFFHQSGINAIFFTGGSSSQPGTGAVIMALFRSTLNVSIGTHLDAGYKLDVNGTARVQGVFRQQTNGGNNYFELVANANGSSPYITAFKSGVLEFKVEFGATIGASFIVGATILFGNSSGSPVNAKVGGLLATGTVESSGGVFGLSSTTDNYIVFQQTGATSRGTIGFATGTSYLQIRTNAATNLTNGTLSTIFDNTGSVGIGGITSVNTSARLQIDSTTKGFLPPRMTTTEKNAIGTPAAGLIVYDTTTNKLCCYNGTTWNDLF